MDFTKTITNNKVLSVFYLKSKNIDLYEKNGQW